AEVAVVLAGAEPRVLVPLTSEHALARQALEAIPRASGRATDVPRALELASRQLGRSDHAQRGIVVFTDGARHARLDEAAPVGPRIAVRYRVLGTEGLENIALSGVEALPDPTTPGHFSLRLDVRGFDASDQEIDVQAEADAGTLARGTVRLVDGRGRTTLHVPESDAPIRVFLEVEDAHPADNERFLLLRQRADVQVVVVDGEAGTERNRSEAVYFARALEAQSQLNVGFRAIDPAVLPDTDLSQTDLLVLANAPAPSRRSAAAIADYVEAGGGLLISAGDKVEPQAYGAVFSDLLPGRLRAQVNQPAPIVAEAPTPTFSITAGGISGTVVRSYLETEAVNAEVVLRLETGSPLLAVGERGNGRVALLATTLDADWSDLPFQPGYLPLVVQLSQVVGRASSLPRRPVPAGQPVMLRSEVSGQIEDPAGRRTDVRGRFDATDLPGVYRLRRDGEEVGAFVVAAANEESELTLGSPPEDREATGDRASSDAGQRIPLAPWLFVLAAIFLVAEGVVRARALA
ncbi:MAG: VWA domain-containing protein, partial [Myxococcota bacterium]